MIIQHNMSAAFANSYVQQNANAYGKSVKKLSTGYRINSAADDAAGLTISEKLRWQVRGLRRDTHNIQDGLSLLQVADGALQEVHDMLRRMDELAVQAANDTNTEIDRDALQTEIDDIADEIDRIGLTTTFNTIDIFKARKSPTMAGKPVDVKVYHLNDGRIGGIIYNGKRYAYDKHGFSFDSNGNVQAGSYTITAEGPAGVDVGINLVFDGTSRVPVGRLYKMEHVVDQGLSIDGIMHLWTDMEDDQGNKLDPGNVIGGKYTFYHSGLAISIELEDKENLREAGAELVPGDGIFTYSLESMGVSQSSPYVTTVSGSSISITGANQNHIPIYNASNEGRYSMNADSTGMWLSYQNQNSQTVNLDKMTWQQLGLTEADFGDKGGINPGHTETEIKDEHIQEEKYKGYTYRDSQTGISLNFNIDSEVSQQEMIDAMNSWSVRIRTNNSIGIQAQSGGSAFVSVNGYSSSLGTFGVQSQMGRDMGTQMTLADGINTGVVAYNQASDKISFNMKDANGTEYIFESTATVKTPLETETRQKAANLKAAYVQNYQNWLNRYGTTRPFTQNASLSTDKTLSLLCAEGYSVGLRYAHSAQWNFDAANFDVVRDPNTNRYTVNYSAAGSAAFDQWADDFVDSVMNSLSNAKVTARTNALTTGVVTPSSSARTNNQQFTSKVVYMDRELKIQAGPLSGQYIGIKLPVMSASALLVRDLDVGSHTNAGTAISLIQQATDRISEIRGGYGATMNRLEAALRMDDVTAENTQASESRLRDTDMAEESVENAKHNILIQCGQSMLAQANHNNDGVMQLLG